MADENGERHKAGAFDIRIFIGALLGIYGVILALTGLFSTSGSQLDKSDGININVWTGIALLIACAVFVSWARMRPVVVPVHHEDDEGSEEDGRADEVAADQR